MSTETNTPTRPRRHDASVMRLAAEKLLARLKVSRPDLVDSENEDYAFKDLCSALRSAWRGDGYDIARALEREGWDADTQLVNEVDGGCLDEAYDDVIRQWIEAHGIAPQLAVGASIIVNPQVSAGAEVRAQGEITGIDLKRGTYTVCVPAWGHVKAGLGTHGRIWSWEEVEGWQHAETPVEVAK